MRRLVSFGTLLGLLAGLVLAPPVAAFDLSSSCMVTVTSIDSAGGSLDTAVGGGVGGTQDKPLKVDLKGRVHYDGSLSEKAGAFSYTVSAYGLPFLSASGNNNTTLQAAGDVDLKAFPIPIVGIYPVSGALSGATASCSGSGWVRIVGDLPTAPQLWVGLVLALLSLGLLFTWARPSFAPGDAR